MVKRILIYTIFVLGIVSCKKQKEAYTITGQIGLLLANETVYLYSEAEKRYVDSVISVNETFFFKGRVEEPSIYYIVVKRFMGNLYYKSFWLENSDITFNGNLSDIKEANITGSVMQAQQDKYVEGIGTLKDKINYLYLSYDNAKEELKPQIEFKIDSLKELENKEKISFIKANPDYMYSAYLTKKLVRNLSQKDGYDLYNSLSATQQINSYGTSAREFLELNKNLQIGDSYVDISLPNSSGENIKLSSFNEKYILIDFWASWCKPCREEIPFLKQAYEKYNDAGFEIYAVSLDTDIDRWLEAIAKDQLVWTNVLSKGAFDSKEAMIYGVKHIPYNFLINPQGEIVEMNLKGEDLLQKLEEVLGS